MQYMSTMLYCRVGEFFKRYIQNITNTNTVMKFRLLIWIHISNKYKYNSTTNSSIFHEKLPNDDPAGLKHVENVYSKTIHNTVTWVIYYELVVLTVV